MYLYGELNVLCECLNNDKHPTIMLLLNTDMLGRDDIKVYK